MLRNKMTLCFEYFIKMFVFYFPFPMILHSGDKCQIPHNQAASDTCFYKIDTHSVQKLHKKFDDPVKVDAERIKVAD